MRYGWYIRQFKFAVLVCVVGLVLAFMGVL